MAKHRLQWFCFYAISAALVAASSPRPGWYFQKSLLSAGSLLRHSAAGRESGW